jgi:hypothetical protein
MTRISQASFFLLAGAFAGRGDAYMAHVVRRVKSNIFEIDPVTKDKKEKFMARHVPPCTVTAVAARRPDFIRPQKALLDLIAPELRRAFRGRRCSSKGGI